MRYPTILEAIGMVVVLIIILSLYRAHKNPSIEINFFDLLVQNGRIDRIACVTMGTWFALTYVFIGIYMDGKMTEGLYTAFGGLCFAPLIAKMFSGPSTTTVTTSNTSEVKEEKK